MMNTLELLADDTAVYQPVSLYVNTDPLVKVRCTSYIHQSSQCLAPDYQVIYS